MHSDDFLKSRLCALRAGISLLHLLTNDEMASLMWLFLECIWEVLEYR